MAPRTATAERPATETKPATVKPAAVQPGTGVAVQTGHSVRSVLYDMADRFGMEPAAFEATLRNTVVPSNCSREQFAAFLLVAKEYSLNPLLKEIYAFPAKSGGIQPIVGVDGWSNLINSHPAFDGMEFDDKLDGANVVAVTCRMFRKDRTHAIAATEYLAECKRNTEPWTKWPRRMLRHKAMIQAARYAFGFAGIVDPDEAERFAGETARDVTPRRVASTPEAFEEFSRGSAADHEAESDELSDPPVDTGIDDEFEDDAVQDQSKPDQAADAGTSASTTSEQEPADTKPQDDEKADEVKEDSPTTWPEGKLPTTEAEYLQFGKATVAGMTNGPAIAEWFKGADQRKLRNDCGVTKETFDVVKDAATKRIAAIAKMRG